MRRFLARWAVLLVVALLPVATALAAPHAQSSGLTLDVQAGFDSYYKEGQWVPLRIVVSNTGPDVSGDLRAVDEFSFSGGEVIFTHPLDLPSGSRKEIFLYFAPSGYLSTLDVDFVVGNRRLARESINLSQLGLADMLYGVVSDNPSAFSELGLVTPENANAQVAILEVEDLPTAAEAWRGLDVIVFSDVDTGQLSADQREALHAWVTSGGRIIVTGGPGWGRTAAGLDAVVPVDVTGSANLNDLSALPKAMGVTFGDFQGETLVSAGQPRPGAQVSVAQDGLPLWVSHDIGLGRVDFLAADPALEPLRSASQIEMLWRTILAEGAFAPSWSDGFNTNYYYAGQAVASIPGVSLPSALQLCGFLSLYAVIVGPLNYLVLRRMKRTELAWITIPSIVLFFSGCAYVTGFQLRGSRAIIHRVAMVQSWPDSEVARVDGMVGLWSPRRATYDVLVGESFLAQPLPGNYGGSFSVISDHVVEQGEGTVLRDVRVDVGAVQSFVVEGYAPARHVEGDLVMSFDAGGSLSVQGEVRNTSGIDLDDAVLLAAGAAQQLGSLADGGQTRVNVSLLSGQSTPAPSGGIQLVPGTGTVNSSGYGGYDTTIDDILGTSYCFGNPETERRCNLLQAAIDQYGGSGGRGAGVYLVGWADDAPLDVSVPGPSSTYVDTAVYFFALPVKIEQSGQNMTIPPSLMTWTLLDSGQGYSYSPYDIYVGSPNQAPIMFRYEPLPSLSLDTVTALTIHVEGYDTANLPPPAIELWNWSDGDWEAVPANWGDTAISQPERFVSDTGAVHLSLVTGSMPQSLSLSRVDVTLEGTPSS